MEDEKIIELIQKIDKEIKKGLMALRKELMTL